MCQKDSKNGNQYFAYEHSHQYQQIQFQFYDAVESLDPQNIGVGQIILTLVMLNPNILCHCK